MEGKFVAYYRVSTARQGRSGLGLDARRQSVADYLNGGARSLLREFVEVESGKLNTRPELEQALHLCKVTGATLIGHARSRDDARQAAPQTDGD